MSSTKRVATILNSTIKSVKTVITLPIKISKPALVSEPFIQSGVGVLIGITGSVYGRLIISGSKELISDLSQSVFGFSINDDMLPSFAGELGNMIAGNVATFVSEEQYNIDITPPTVLYGANNIYGFETAIKLIIDIENKGILSLVLALEEK